MRSIRPHAALRRLLAASIVLGAACAAIAATPAFATNEYYPHPGEFRGCGKCAKTEGPLNFILNNESENLSGEGLCDAAYLSSGTTVFNNCYSSGTGVILCYSGSEFYGNGQTRRYYKEFEYNLIGRQDNFQTCG